MNDNYENFKEQVRSQADIVKVVSDYVALKKKGPRYWGCCPFHSEKTPSFTVTPQKNLFHCFGCHAGGDVFNFIMKIENTTFPEAVKILAKKFGIAIPEKEKTEQEIQKEKASRELFDANALAVKFFQACLLKTEYGRKALEYLNGRGIDAAIIEKFSIGLAPPAFQTLLAALKSRGVSEELLVRAGLVVRRDDGKTYDRFRERVMIPIKDARGRVVGFTGRILGAGQPKYLNTGETDVFTKRSLLFGMDVALKAAREKRQIIVVEGHMDAIRLHASGIIWAVASMGTAFTEQHAGQIARAVPEVVFAFDNDEAGLKAAMDAIPLALKAGLEVRVLVVPKGKDPDDFIRSEGPEAFLNLLGKAPSGIDFQIERTLKQNNFSGLEGKVKTVSNILPLLLECKSDIEVVSRIRSLAQTLTIDENLLVGEYKKIRLGSVAPLAPRLTAAGRERNFDPVEQAERQLLFALIDSCVEDKAERFYEKIEETVFLDETRAEIYRKFRELARKSGRDIGADLFSELKEGAAAELSLILQQELVIESAERVIGDCLKQLQLARLEKDYEYHGKLAAEYERNGDEKFLQELTESQRILAESQRLKNELKNVF